MRKLNLLSGVLEPTRIFIAILIAVIFWLFPFLSFKKQTVQPIEHGSIISAAPYTAGAIGECSNVVCDPGYCCQFGYCVVRNKADCSSGGGSGDQPPTISASLDCSQPGDNGWCTGALSVNLSASDPQGQSIIISGTLDGVAFACPDGATSCSIPIDNEGSGLIDYQVDSATGLSANGSAYYQLDTSTPDLYASLSGVPGTNNWLISDTTLDVTASDSVSGAAYTVVSINSGAPTTYTAPLTFTDGTYTVEIITYDNAGNASQDTEFIQVDTLTPSLSLTTTGTSGSNGWYVSATTVTPTASDSGSGLAALEAKVDGGSWSIISSSLSLSDGIHAYQFRATDNAGNVTETPSQTLMVDTVGPSINMTEELSLGETLYYELQDKGSGLSIYRAVIEDEDERYKKIVWLDTLSGSKLKDQILWDGKFADGTSAGAGEYYITLKISDAAGNESRKTAIVTVNPFSFLQSIPAFVPPSTSSQQSSTQDSLTVSSTDSPVISFGGVTVTTKAGEYVTTKSAVVGASNPITNAPINSNILWGAAAAALTGAALADWERKRKEEERVQQDATAQKRANTEKRWAQKAQEDAVRERRGQGNRNLPLMPDGLSPEAQAAYLHGDESAINWLATNAGKLRAQYSLDQIKKQERSNKASAARWAGIAAIAQAKEKERMNYVSAARWTGVAAIAQAKESEQQARDQVAFSHRMDEHTGEQSVIIAWEQEQEISRRVIEGPIWEPAPDTQSTYPAPSDKTNIFDRSCEVADAIDPNSPGLEFVETDKSGWGNLIDQSFITMQQVPYVGSPYLDPFIWTGKKLTTAAVVIKDSFSTGYNFVCQQIKQEGPYYETLPLNKAGLYIQDQWNTMTLVQKITFASISVVTIIIAATTILAIL
jgi:hypothetical protein